MSTLTAYHVKKNRFKNPDKMQTNRLNKDEKWSQAETNSDIMDIHILLNGIQPNITQLYQNGEVKDILSVACSYSVLN